MGWAGKAVGIGIGSFIGGPFGAVVGGVLGHLYDKAKNLKQEVAPSNTDANSAMAKLFGSVFYELASLSGPVPGKVRNAALSVLSDLNKTLDLGFAPNRLEAFFASDGTGCAKRTLIDLSSRFEDGFKFYFYGWLIRISVADGVQSENEKAYIQDFLDAFHIDPQVSAFISRLYLYPASRRGATAEVKQAAGLLNVPSDADCATIKRAYRKQCMIYHPDHLGDVAPEIRALAADRFEKITGAYELLTGLSGSRTENLWALDADSGVSACVRPGQVIRCLCCGAKIRIPDPFNPTRARCPKCQSLLAFEKNFVETWIDVHKK